MIIETVGLLRLAAMLCGEQCSVVCGQGRGREGEARRDESLKQGREQCEECREPVAVLVLPTQELFQASRRLSHQTLCPAETWTWLLVAHLSLTWGCLASFDSEANRSS